MLRFLNTKGQLYFTSTKVQTYIIKGLAKDKKIDKNDQHWHCTFALHSIEIVQQKRCCCCCLYMDRLGTNIWFVSFSSFKVLSGLFWFSKTKSGSHIISLQQNFSEDSPSRKSRVPNFCQQSPRVVIWLF